jgi:hypothetical protein
MPPVILLLALAATAGQAQHVEDSVDVGGAWVGSLAYNSQADVVYGASEDGFVFAIDCATNELVATIPGGGAMSKQVVPLSARLLEPVPSVTTSQVRLSFCLNTIGKVDLRAYDVAGRVVARLASGLFSPGQTDIVWDGRGADGRRLAAGTYFVRLSTGRESTARKVVFSE